MKRNRAGLLPHEMIHEQPMPVKKEFLQTGKLNENEWKEKVLMHRKFTLDGSTDTQIVCAINTTPKQKWELKVKNFKSDLPSDKWVMFCESPPIDMVVGELNVTANWSKTSIVDDDPISKLGIGLLRHGEEIVC